MKTRTTELIRSITNMCEEHITQAEEWKKLDEDSLNFKPSPEKWSILECLEHINLYGDFYIPTFSKAIESKKGKSQEWFNSGFLGNYFANSMLPKDKLNKMKTFKDKDPAGSNLDSSVIDRFIGQQNEYKDLFKKAMEIDMAKTRIPISIATWLKIKLGDGFRFIKNHDHRHILQARRVEKDLFRSQVMIDTSN